MDKFSYAGNMEQYIEQFAQYEKNLNGGTKQKIHQIRKNAFDHFTKLGFPTTKNEEWKYTDIRQLAKTDFARTISPEISKTDIEPFQIDNLDGHTLVFVDGIFKNDLSQVKDLPDRVQLLSIREYLETNPEDSINFLSQYSEYKSDAFTALNTAFIDDGMVLIIPKNTVIEKPVHIIYLTDSRSNRTITVPRNLIVVDENSQARIIETYANLGEKTCFTNSVSEIILHNNANVIHYKIQQENASAYHISSNYVYQNRDSHFKSFNFTFGGKLVRNNINTILDNEGIECTLNGLYVGTDDQHIDNHTSIDHASPHCYSEELYKGILDDKAHGVFNGKIMVRPDAQKTNAIQSNNSILLSDDASIDTKPQLEIFADDVRCTHGATIGQLDEDAYFYLRSRGIDKVKARQFLIYAFASDVIDRVDIEPVRNKLADLLAEKLHTVKPE